MSQKNHDLPFSIVNKGCIRLAKMSLKSSAVSFLSPMKIQMPVLLVNSVNFKCPFTPRTIAIKIMILESTPADDIAVFIITTLQFCPLSL